MESDTTSLFRPPSELAFDGNLKKNWSNWKAKFDIFLIASKRENDQERVKVAMLKNIIGDQANDVLKTFTYSCNEDQVKLSQIYDLMNKYVEPKKNLTLSRFQFFTMNQTEGQSIESFITEVTLKSKECEFDTDENICDSLVRDRIICGIQDKKLQENILRTHLEDVKLDKVIKLCRVASEARAQSDMLNESTGVNRVSCMSISSENTVHRAERTSVKRENHTSAKTYKCTKYCGTNHLAGECPAFHHRCKECQRTGHYELCCWRKKKGINVIRAEAEEKPVGPLTDSFLVSMVKETDTDIDWKFTTLVNGERKIEFKLDTGADVNLISYQEYLKLNGPPSIKHSSVKLSAYNNSKIPIKGECVLPIVVHNKLIDVKFIVAEFGNIIGGKLCHEEGIVSRVCSVSMSEYSDLFTGLGKFKQTHTLHLRDDAVPVVHAPRRVPEALLGRLETELKRMEELGVIVKVTEPTDWVSSLVLIEKHDKSLRVCLDPKDLNKAIKRTHYPLPTVDDLLNKLSGAKFFSKLDASSGYWQIPVDEESSQLLTFNSPFGRYRFTRVPFGIHSASELFQRTIEDMIRGIEGAANLQDDIIVWAETQEEHDKRLKQVLDVIKESGMKLNPQKCQFSQTEVIFLGHKVTADGIKPDPSKTSAIDNIPEPKTKLELQRFLGMINFIGKFIPNLAKIAGPLRELLHKGREFHMSDVHRESFLALKRMATTAPVLKNFSQGKEIKVSGDSSEYGLGAVILQKHGDRFHPVAYASRTLNKTEHLYAQIEKECLAVVFAVTRFHQYLYGNQFLLETDHNPLVSIIGKELSKMPARIQRMMLKIQAYPELTLKYTPGSKLLIADTLSRAPEKNQNSPEIKDIDLQVHRVIENLPIIPERMKEILNETKKDNQLIILKGYIHNGWPKKAKECHPQVAAYWGMQEYLTTINDIVFRNEQVVIPTSLRAMIKEKIHSGHLGISKCKERARANFYWPNINADIERMIKACGPCQENRNMQPKEKNIAVEAEYPWQIVGSDIFHFAGSHFLIVTDYFSGFPEVEYIGKNPEYPTTKSIVNKLGLMFARQGIPEKLITDGGSQYTSVEFREFTKKWGFGMQTSSPEYPRGNGRAERSVQTVKQLIRKDGLANFDFWSALLEYRTTPITGSHLSPAEMMFDRTIRSQLTLHKRPQRVEESKRQVGQRKYKIPKRDRSNKEMPELSPGDTVRIWNRQKKKWTPLSTVIKKIDSAPRSYLIETEAGRRYRRNRYNLLKTEETFVSDNMNMFDQSQTEGKGRPRGENPQRADTPKRAEAPQRAKTRPIAETRPLAEMSQRAETPQQAETPQRAETPQQAETPQRAETLQRAEALQRTETPQQAEMTPREEMPRRAEMSRQAETPKRDIYSTYLSREYQPYSDGSLTPSSEYSSSSTPREEAVHPDNTTEYTRINTERHRPEVERLGVSKSYIEKDPEWTASEEDSDYLDVSVIALLYNEP